MYQIFIRVGILVSVQIYVAVTVKANVLVQLVVDITASLSNHDKSFFPLAKFSFVLTLPRF